MKALSTQLTTVFRNNVAEKLRRLGWSRSDFAAQLGVTPSYITQVMGGHRGVGLEAVEKFANALDVAPSSLLVEKKSKVPVDTACSNR